MLSATELAAKQEVLTDEEAVSRILAGGFHLIATMTDMAKSERSWKGETGFINQEMLTTHLPSLQGPIYYLAGPPAMVTAMRKMLADAAVDVDDIRTEEFSGY